MRRLQSRSARTGTFVFLIAALAVVLSLPARAEDCPVGMTAMRQLELFFGTSIKRRAAVNARAWSRFLASEVTPRFPDGLTIFEAHGQWRGTGGAIVGENAHVLVVLYPPDDKVEAKIEAIRRAYEKRFDQDSVMRVESAACVSF
jgi:hypothetical protein